MNRTPPRTPNTPDFDRWIDFDGRDENGDKVYAVQYEGHDVGTFKTHDEAVIALREYIAWARFGTLQKDEHA